jgi:hypothetical protein
MAHECLEKRGITDKRPRRASFLGKQISESTEAAVVPPGEFDRRAKPRLRLPIYRTHPRFRDTTVLAEAGWSKAPALDLDANIEFRLVGCGANLFRWGSVSV